MDMIHYHGTPITPIAALLELAGRHFCVSHAAPQDVARCHQIGQSVMLDNGAFSAWKSGKATSWTAFYAWADKWLDYPTTWAVIPDVIDAGTQEQDALLREWPHGTKGAPVWHMDEPINRLLRRQAIRQRLCRPVADCHAEGEGMTPHPVRAGYRGPASLIATPATPAPGADSNPHRGAF